jgi:hypothetical protein
VNILYRLLANTEVDAETLKFSTEAKFSTFQHALCFGSKGGCLKTET